MPSSLGGLEGGAATTTRGSISTVMPSPSSVDAASAELKLLERADVIDEVVLVEGTVTMATALTEAAEIWSSTAAMLTSDSVATVSLILL